MNLILWILGFIFLGNLFKPKKYRIDGDMIYEVKERSLIGSIFSFWFGWICFFFVLGLITAFFV